MVSYAHIAKSLTNQLKKKCLPFNMVATSAIEELKFAMIKALVVSMPNISHSFVIEINASSNGVGAVIL